MTLRCRSRTSQRGRQGRDVGRAVNGTKGSDLPPTDVEVREGLPPETQAGPDTPPCRSLPTRTLLDGPRHPFAHGSHVYPVLHTLRPKQTDEMGGAPGGAKKLDGAEPRGRWERPLGVPRRAGESPPRTHGRMRVLGGCDGAPHWAASPAEIHSLTGQGRKSETGVLAGLGSGGSPSGLFQPPALLPPLGGRGSQPRHSHRPCLRPPLPSP